MTERAAYSRIYWSIIDDPKFHSVYDDDRLLSAWLRLLLIADQAWPASAHVPSSVRRGAIESLEGCGLLLRSGHRYRITGLDAERERRAEAAKRVLTRTQAGPKRDPEQAGVPGLRRDETRRDETSSSAREDDRPDIEAFLLVTRRAPTERQRKLLDGLLDRHDLTGPQWAADIILRHPDDPIGAVIEADKAYRAERIAEAQAAERPKPMPRRPRGLPTATRELIDEWAKQKRDPAA